MKSYEKTSIYFPLSKPTLDYYNSSQAFDVNSSGYEKNIALMVAKVKEETAVHLNKALW